MTRARHLWKSATKHERLLWRHLRNRQLQGWKFRRQHPVDRCIIDFYCPEARLAIELDSGGHNFANREPLDQERTRFLASKNIGSAILELSDQPWNWEAFLKRFGRH
jgi:very-short-patch-repair endonuclease